MNTPSFLGYSKTLKQMEKIDNVFVSLSDKRQQPFGLPFNELISGCYEARAIIFFFYSSSFDHFVDLVFSTALNWCKSKDTLL